MRLSGNERPGEWPFEGEHKCIVCGGGPSAIWRGHGILYICPHCARDILPRLIADALTPEDSVYGTILDNFRSLETPYLQAAFCRVAGPGSR